MYNHKEIEKKWQEFWEKNKTFKTENNFSKPKFYTLDMFPYPSGAGLHVGHPKGYVANDILARFKHTKGFNVLHPMGWDAFGLPAENYAIKTGTHPRITTDENIETYKKQLSVFGFSYDWDREIDTTDPEYYKWTQWIFLKLFENGLAYEQDLPINYCPSCKTGLANEEVLNDFTCERCGTKVEKRKIRQWVLAITKYAERLLADVDKLDWPESIKEMQRNWIGKSEGCEFRMRMAENVEGIAENRKREKSDFNDESFEIIGCAMKAQNELGSGLQEKVYQKGLKVLLEKAGFKVEEEVKIDYTIEGEKVGYGKIDLLVNRKIAIELKSRKYLEGDAYKQLRSYINQSKNIHTGLLLNFYNKKLEYKRLESDYKQNILGNSQNNSLPFISVYTTRIDTVFGMTYAVLAPDHKDVNNFITSEQKEICKEYIENSAKKSDQDRTQDDKEKTGVFTGSYVINPFNNEKIPLWIGDYVLGNYGTGAVMAVPAHDTRDFEFAKKYNLEIKESISGGNISEKAFTDYGILVNSGDFNGLKSKEAKIKMTDFAEKQGFGTKKINYKLRDWLFSRQRYWGEPIPLIHLKNEDVDKLPKEKSDDTWVKDSNILMIGDKEFSKIYDGIYGKIVCDYSLPLKLPEVENYEPSGDGNSPLAKVDSFVNIELTENLVGKRETNTMPQWGGSCWYYLRFMDPKNSENLVDPEIEKYWGEVDSYVGGAEHAVLHLLYARFWQKFLFDIGVVSNDEPFYRLRNQGLILAHAFQRKNGGLLANDLVEEKDGKYYEISSGEEVNRIISKMSKSLKNVVNPDDIIEEYGADSLRLYEMYLSDFKDTAPWDTKGIIGVRRFLEKSERLFGAEAKFSTEDDNFTMKLLHKTIKKIEEDIENYKFNTSIAALMILVNNGLPKDEILQSEWKETFIKLLHPFAPHLSEELWERIGNKTSVFETSWPKFDEKMVVDDTIKIGVQVLGKLRGTIEISKDEDKESVLKKAKENEDVAKWLEGKTLVKEIYVPGRIVNLVVK